MIGFIFAVIYAAIVRKLHGKFHFSKKSLDALNRVKHHGTVISEGIEFHFFMTFLFPLTHGFMAAASHTAHIEWLMALYGH